MGQCSTLPAETRSTTVFLSTRKDEAYGASTDEQRRRLSEGGRKESLDFNTLVTPEQMTKQESSKQYKLLRPPSESGIDYKSDPGAQSGQQSQPQSRDPDQLGMEDFEGEPMDVDSREDAPLSIPPPPEGALRTRCYRLNLDSDFVGLSSTQKQQLCLGPFVEPPPYLTYSTSEDSSLDSNPTKIAIQTAQIFRGITVSRDGTILTQNARATRSNRGNKPKRGEKSRQAAKIDKAKDLVEEAILSGKNKSPDEPTTMVSLVIIGEYDDMKQLVRDGSKKLREAEGLPDEALLSVNRARLSQKPKHNSSPSNAGVPSPRKRNSMSPNFVNSQRTAAMHTPEKIDKTPPATVVPQSTPPKLKVHPRDNRPTKREDRAEMRMRLDACHDFMDPRRGGTAGDGDWSHAWNIWNCGASGTASPHQPSSPNEEAQAVFEGRDSAYGHMRDGGLTGRAK